ncbi:MAG TPA: M1 family peptidase, partial [Polyangiaceae bacterium]
MRTSLLLVALFGVALQTPPSPETTGAPAIPPAAQPSSPAAALVAPIVAGAAFDDDAALPPRAEDVADYTLRATLDPALHTVHGEGTITWKNTSTTSVRELWLHLYLNAFKNERSAYFREHVGGRGSAPPEDWGWIDVRKLVLRGADGGAVDVWPTAELRRPGDDDETDARVPLPREVEPGETISLDVAFDDKLPLVIERTGYRDRYHMVGQWFPKIARLEPDGRWAHFPFHHLAEFYADFGTYDVTLDVPAAYSIGATGPVVEWHVADGRRVERHVQSDVHDFAWTASDAWQTARETIDGVDVTLLYPRGFTRIAQRELATLRFGLPYYSARYGRYPYKVLTAVHPQEDAAESGGMEYPTLITTG